MSTESSQITLAHVYGTTNNGSSVDHTVDALLNDNTSGIQTFENTEYCYSSYSGEINHDEYIKVDFEE